MEKIVLSNGLRVVMEKIPTGRSVSFGIWVKTGSRNEHPGNNGISHFVEHMLFKGTDRYSAKDIAEQFDAIGGNVMRLPLRNILAIMQKYWMSICLSQ